MKDIEKRLFKDMKDSIGTKDPIVFFEALSKVTELMMERLDKIESTLGILNIQSSLSIHWDPQIASEMLVSEIAKMRESKEVFATELSAFKEAYAKGLVVKDYQTFVSFWQSTLGWHPFIDQV